MMQIITDAALGIWIALIVAGIFSLPLLFRAAAAPPGELAGRALLTISLGVPLAASAHLFNWATALLLCGASFVTAVRATGGTAWVRIVAAANLRGWMHRARRSAERVLVDRRIHAIAGLALLSGAAPAVQAVLNTRLSGVDEYSLLASTHRLLSGQWLGTLLPAPSLVAMVSTVSATDPLQVVRFLKPVLHLACAVSAASLVRRATWQRHLSWLCGAFAGVAVLRVHSSIDLLAVTTLFGGLAILQRARRMQVSLPVACGVLTMSVLPAPALGIFVAAAAAVSVGAPLKFVPEGVGIVLLLAALVEPYLFEGVASLAPCFFVVGTALACRQIVRRPLRALGRGAQAIAYARAGLVTPALLMLALPPGMQATYVEPDSAARQALSLKQSHTGARWAVVGAHELQIQIGAAALVIDLQEFVARYGASAGMARFRFDVPADRVFVFVEKRPMLDAQSGIAHRDDTLDRAVYRIPRLRSDLQHAALELCEAYRRTHSGVSVHYEDEDLRIYLITL